MFYSKYILLNHKKTDCNLPEFSVLFMLINVFYN